MSDVVIAGAKRTAIGSFLGQFSGVPTPTLGATAIRAALEHAGIAAQLPQSGSRLLEMHRQLLAALRRRDSQAAENLMRKHIQDYRRGCEFTGLDMAQPIPPLD